jgi:fatty acid-binding protein DegV
VAQLQEAFPETEVLTLDLGAAFVTQGGPGCIAIQYIEKRK